MNAESFDRIVITDADSSAFDQFFAIYEEALPPGERKSRADIAALVQRTDYAIVGLARAGEVVAFAIVLASNTQLVGLLEYMATAKTMRNAGLGARLFSMALERMGERVMLVEVDSEREQAKDLAIRIRRKNFYLRLGCIQIEGLDYLMPAVSEERPPVMDLLYHAGGRAHIVTGAQLRVWLTTLYVEVYGRSADDSDIALMLERRAALIAPGGDHGEVR